MELHSVSGRLEVRVVRRVSARESVALVLHPGELAPAGRALLRASALCAGGAPDRPRSGDPDDGPG